jgi:hypothetical protein
MTSTASPTTSPLATLSPLTPSTPATPTTPQRASTTSSASSSSSSSSSGDDEKDIAELMEAVAWQERRGRSDAAARKRRALQDPIYYIDHQVRTNSVSFRVLGTSGSDYTIDYFGHQPKWICACRDFQIRNRPCKHIHFIWYRVLGIGANSGITQPFFDSVDAIRDRLLAHNIAHQHTFLALSSSTNTETVTAPVPPPPLPRRPRHEEKGVMVAVPLAVDDVGQRPYIGQSCPICYEEFSSDSLVYYCHEKCGNSVHQDCFQAFVRFAKKTNCPYCRHHMVPDGLDISAINPHKRRRRYRY